MKEPNETRTQDATLALHTRRKFLKKALMTAAYVAPVVLSYPSAVFAAHCNEASCGGADHMSGAAKAWSPGCSRLN